MIVRMAILMALCTIVSSTGYSQTELFEEAFSDFATKRIRKFEEIEINWKMKGSIQADLNEGLNSLLEDNPRLAIESFDTVLAVDKTVWQAYYYRAAAYKQLKKSRIAKKDIEAALKLRGDFYEGYVELAKILYLMGDTDESERAINKAIRLDGSRGAAYYVKGDINLAQDQPRIAINKYEECLAVDSLFHDARLKIALLNARTKRKFDDALVHLNKVLSYDSLQRNALLFRSILHLATDKKKSIQDFTSLISVDPTNMFALWYRGLTFAELGDYDRAFTDFNKLLKNTSVDDNNFEGQQSFIDKRIDLQNVGAYVVSRVYGLPEDDARNIKRAYCLVILGKYDESIAALDAVSADLKEPSVVYLKAIAHEHKGEHHKALLFYNRAILADNTNADALKKRAIYCQELKRWDESVRDFTAVLKLYPDAFLINRLRGVSYYYWNKFDDAIKDFNIYLKNDSTNKEVISYRGMGYSKTNQKLKAYLDFAVSDHAEAIDFKLAEHLIDSTLQKTDTTTALYYLDGILKETPFFTEGFVQRFKIHQAKNEWEPIEKNINRAVRYSRTDSDKSKHSYLLTIQAMYMRKLNHRDDALDLFNNAIKVDDKNHFAYLERGRLLAAMGKTSKAMDDYKKAVALGNREAKGLIK